MSLQDIINTIKKEAEVKIKEIEKEAQKKIKEIEKESSQKITEEKSRLMVKVKKEAQNRVTQAEYQALAQTKSQVLQKKQELINKVFDRALNRLGSLSDDQYLKLISGLIEKLPIADKGMIIPAQDKEVLTKKALAKTTNKYSIGSKPLSCQGGFIFESDRFNIDNTFETLLEQLRAEIETEVSKILFI